MNIRRAASPTAPYPSLTQSELYSRSLTPAFIISHINLKFYAFSNNRRIRQAHPSSVSISVSGENFTTYRQRALSFITVWQKLTLELVYIFHLAGKVAFDAKLYTFHTLYNSAEPKLDDLEARSLVFVIPLLSMCVKHFAKRSESIFIERLTSPVLSDARSS